MIRKFAMQQMVARSRVFRWQPLNVEKTKTAVSNRSEPNGTVLSCSGARRNLRASILKKDRRFILRDEFRPLNTKIKMEMIAGLLRLSLER